MDYTETLIEDNAVTFVNFSHYQRVRNARRELGLGEFDKSVSNRAIDDHSYIGKEIFHRKRGVWYLIEGVNLQWYGGFYYGMLIQHNGSHAFKYFENVNSINRVVREAVQKFAEEFDMESIRCTNARVL